MPDPLNPFDPAYGHWDRDGEWRDSPGAAEQRDRDLDEYLWDRYARNGYRECDHPDTPEG